MLACPAALSRSSTVSASSEPSWSGRARKPSHAAAVSTSSRSPPSIALIRVTAASESESKWAAGGSPAGGPLASYPRSQRHDAQAGALAGVGRDVREEGGPGQQLERRVQHERVPVADDLVTGDPDDRGGGVDEPVVVEPDEVATVVLVGDVVHAHARQRVGRRGTQDV